MEKGEFQPVHAPDTKLIPALLHGFYDFTASRETSASSILFIVFVIVMFVTAYRLVKHVAANDTYIRNYRFGIIRNNSADPK